MKTHGMMVGLLALSLLAASAGEYRTFRSTDGRSIEARMVEHDAKRGRIKIERRGGKTMWVTPGVFGEADQAYIEDWAAGSDFLNTTKVRGTIQPVKDGDDLHYELTLRNQSSTSFADLKVEYLIRVRISGSGSIKDHYRYEGGILTEVNLRTADQIVVSTASARMSDKYMTTRWVDSSGGTVSTSRKRLSAEKPNAVWFRVSRLAADGLLSIRHFCDPKDVMEEEEWIPADRTLLVSILKTNELLQEEKAKTKTENGLLIGTDMSRLASIGRSKVRLLDQRMRDTPTKSEARQIHAEMVPLYIMGVDDYMGVYSGHVGKLLYEKGLVDEGLLWLEVSSGIGNGFAPYVRAEILSTSHREELHDGEKAVDAIESVEPGGYYYKFAVRAAAYARNEQFSRAVEEQKKAIEAYQKHSCQCVAQQDAMNQHLALYEQGKPRTRTAEEPPFWLDPCYLRHKEQ